MAVFKQQAGYGCAHVAQSKQCYPHFSVSCVISAEIIPQRLKPSWLQSIFVRAEARTLRKNEFVRSLFSPSSYSFCPSDRTAPKLESSTSTCHPGALRISYYAALINDHVCGFL